MEKLRILAVDDNMVNLASLEQELKDEYEVIPVSSGKRAIKFLYIEKVDLILLDVQMPIMDGIETLKEIRTQENGITVPVILLTAKKDKETVIEGSKLGIMDYIVKPVNSDDLHERVKRALKRRGVLPMEGEELYKLIKDALASIQGGKLKAAVMKIDEIMGYQIEEAVSGRVHAAKVKLQSNDLAGAESMIQRVLKMMERNQGIGASVEKPTISLGELNSRILYI
ncbi:MAG: response regulator, partial [Lachnospiraceae bacterium]|nr:response regulator [Lachnospiraceae bacterium]